MLSKTADTVTNSTTTISTSSIIFYLAAIRSYFAYHDIDVIPSKFKRKVKIPKVPREDEQPLDIEDIRKILLSCHNRRLKAYLLVLASGGLRALEGLAIRLRDIDFTTCPTKIHIRKEFAKTKVSRDIYISDEATQILKQWLEWKHHNQRRNIENPNPDDLVFTISDSKRPQGFYSKECKMDFKKQLEYKKETVIQITGPIYEEGSTLPYLGKNYPLKIVNHQKDKENKFELINEEFLVSLGINSRASKRKIKALYEEWLMQKARPIFEEKVKQYSTQLAIKPSQIIIKNLKSRWGSATKGHAINLNVNLLKASDNIIDYVVLHELCHLKIKEHSHRFWELIHRFMPNYQDKINWLKVNESGLLHGHSRGD